MADQTTLDLADLSFWDSTPEERAEAFAVLRRRQSVARYPMPATLWTPDPDPEDSYWAVLGYEDIRALSRDVKHFTTTQGIQWEDLTPEIVEASTSFLGMDDPRHATVRASRSIPACLTESRDPLNQPKQIPRCARDDRIGTTGYPLFPASPVFPRATRFDR